MGCSGTKTSNNQPSMDNQKGPRLGYLNHIKNGIVYLDPHHFYSAGVDKSAVFELKHSDSVLVAKSIQEEKIEKVLSSNLGSFRNNKLRSVNNQVELGVHETINDSKKDLTLFAVVPNKSLAYFNELCNLISNNKLKNFTKLIINENLSLANSIRLVHALKNNKTINNFSLTVKDELILNTILNNLTSNKSIKKIKCNKVGMTTENLGSLGEFLRFNNTFDSLTLTNNQIDTLESVVEPFVKLNSSNGISAINLGNNKLKEFGALGEVISKNPNKLTKLKLAKCQIKDEEDFNKLFDSWKSCVNLQYLDLSFNYVSFKVLVEFVQNFPALNKLILQRPNVDENDEKVQEEIKEFGKAYGNAKNIKHLAINFKMDKSLISFAQGLTEASNETKSDKSFKLIKTSLNEEACRTLLPQLAHFKELDLSRATFASLEELTNALSHSSTVNTLHLTGCYLKEFSFLSKLLKENKSITTLNLEDNPLSDNDMMELTDSLSVSNVKSLNLNFCFNQNSSPKALTEFCEKLKLTNLEELFIENGDFTPGTFGDDISKLLANHNHLKVLKLGSKNELFNQANNSKILTAIKTNNKHIETLSITNIQLQPNALAEFFKSPLEKLTNIHLHHASAGVPYLAELTKAKSLQGISISLYSFLNESEPACLSSALKSLPKLENFNLNIPAKNLKPEHLDKIFDGLSHNKVIKRFDLVLGESVLPIEFATVLEKYYKHVQTCPSLTNLNFLTVAEERVEIPSEMKEKISKILSEI